MFENDPFAIKTKVTDKIFWPQLALAASAMIASIAGMNLPNFSWLLYLGGFVLLISLTLMIMQSPIGDLMKMFLLSYKNKAVLKSIDKEYWEFVEKFKVVLELKRELDSVPWGNMTPLGHPSVENALIHISTQLSRIANEARIIGCNLALKETIGIVDHYLFHCDQLFRMGRVRYKSEDQKNRIVRLVNRYESLIQVHNELCEKTNKKLDGIYLLSICTHEHGFNWKGALPE
jgi:hypothetical protein